MQCLSALASDGLCAVCSVWDIRTRHIVKTLETSKNVLSLEIVDSNLFITADDRFVKLWDANSYQVVKSYTLPYQVESATYSPQKQRFAAGGEDMWVHLYDSATGDEVDTNKGNGCWHLCGSFQEIESKSAQYPCCASSGQQWCFSTTLTWS